MNNDTDEHQSPFRKTRYPFLRRYHANEIYYLWFKHKGKRHQYSLETKDEATALTIAKRDMAKLIAGAKGQKVDGMDKATLGQLLSELDSHETARRDAREIKPGTFGSIQDGLIRVRKDLAAWLERPAVKITKDELEEYIRGVKGKESPTTVNRVVDTLKHAYALGVEKDLLSEDPTLKIKRASTHEVKSDQIPTEEQYQTLLAAVRQSKLSHKFHVIDLVEFLTAFGPRIREAANCLKTDVDLERGIITFRSATTKNGKARTVPIFEHARPLVERLLNRKSLRIYGKEVRADKLLAISKCYGTLRTIADKYQLPVRGHHTFRHLCATRWLEAGVGVKHVAGWLGHQDGGKLALGIYTHARTEQDNHEAAKVDAAFKAKEPAPSDKPAETIVINGVTYTRA